MHWTFISYLILKLLVKCAHYKVLRCGYSCCILKTSFEKWLNNISTHLDIFWIDKTGCKRKLDLILYLKNIFGHFRMLKACHLIFQISDGEIYLCVTQSILGAIMLNPIEKFKVAILHLNRDWNHWNGNCWNVVF